MLNQSITSEATIWCCTDSIIIISSSSVVVKVSLFGWWRCHSVSTSQWTWWIWSFITDRWHCFTLVQHAQLLQLSTSSKQFCLFSCSKWRAILLFVCSHGTSFYLYWTMLYCVAKACWSVGLVTNWDWEKNI